MYWLECMSQWLFLPSSFLTNEHPRIHSVHSCLTTQMNETTEIAMMMRIGGAWQPGTRNETLFHCLSFVYLNPLFSFCFLSLTLHTLHTYQRFTLTVCGLWENKVSNSGWNSCGREKVQTWTKQVLEQNFQCINFFDEKSNEHDLEYGDDNKGGKQDEY